MLDKATMFRCRQPKSLLSKCIGGTRISHSNYEINCVKLDNSIPKWLIPNILTMKPKYYFTTEIKDSYISTCQINSHYQRKEKTGSALYSAQHRFLLWIYTTYYNSTHWYTAQIWSKKLSMYVAPDDVYPTIDVNFSILTRECKNKKLVDNIFSSNFVLLSMCWIIKPL